MSICVISDTHNNVQALQRALETMKSLAPRTLIHCGDLTDPEILDVMAAHIDTDFERRPDVYIVYGNNDFDVYSIDQACRTYGYRAGPFHEIEAGGKRLFACHGHRRFRKDAIASGTYDTVFSGHSHVAEDEKVGSTRTINPGALYRARQYSFIHYEAETDTARFMRVPK